MEKEYPYQDSEDEFGDYEMIRRYYTYFSGDKKELDRVEVWTMVKNLGLWRKQGIREDLIEEAIVGGWAKLGPIMWEGAPHTFYLMKIFSE